MKTNTEIPLQENSRINETYQVGGLTLKVLTTNHNLAHVPDLEAVVAEVKQSQVVFPEYFNHRIQSESQIGLPIEEIAMDVYKGRNALFDVLEDEYTEGTAIICIDPAYNETFIHTEVSMTLAHYGLVIIPAVIATLDSNVVPKLIAALKRKQEPEQREISRREFIFGATIATAEISTTIATSHALVTFLRGFITDDEKNFNVPLKYSQVKQVEDDIRHTIIAKQLKHLGDYYQGVEATLIYPPGHWERIKYYLENEEELEQAWQRWYPIISLSNDFVTGKAYRKNSQGEWDVLGEWQLPTT